MAAYISCRGPRVFSAPTPRAGKPCIARTLVTASSLTPTPERGSSPVEPTEFRTPSAGADKASSGQSSEQAQPASQSAQYYPLDHEAVTQVKEPFQPIVDGNGKVGLEPVYTTSFEHLTGEKAPLDQGDRGDATADDEAKQLPDYEKF